MWPGVATATAGYVSSDGAADTQADRAAVFTICPKCALTLVVTAADLRVAQGYVRCGRCSSVFNALVRLTDERHGAAAGGETDDPAADMTAETAPDSSPQAASPARDETDADAAAIPEDALEFNPETADVDAVFIDAPPNPQWTAATGSFRAMVAANQEPEPREPPDAQVDVEIDAAYLATLLRSEPARPSGDSAGSAPQSTAKDSARSQAAHLESEPGPQPSRSASPLRDSGAAAAAAIKPGTPAARNTAAATGSTAGTSSAAATRSTAATSSTAAARTTPPAKNAPAARHAVRHARPPAQAAVKPSPVAAATRSRTAAEPRREVRIEARQPPGEASEELTLEEESAAEVSTHDHGAPAILARLARQRWRIGAALALVLLAAQVVNHHRDELAATARLNRPLTALYSFLGVQLAPHWDLRAYDVRQLGASVDGAASGLITVRASIKNAATQPQPLPLLRVTLQDRFGNRIAARDVAPRFYVPPAMPASSFLSGGQRIDAEMAFVDPGANAVGFEIDACLPASGGGVACANDVSAR
jgi:predicted Zn finger-like uncharacterized protein